MESIILFSDILLILWNQFSDNALIYSPNVFFIFLALLLSFIIFLIVNAFRVVIKSVRNTAEHIIEIQKKRKKTKHNKNKFSLKIKYLLKIILVMFTIVNRKKARIIFYARKILNAIKEEVLIKEGEQI